MTTGSIDLQALAEQLCQLCDKAGAAIVKVYQLPDSLQVGYKSDDSPITQADTLAHDIIIKGLTALMPQWPILSEEAAEPDFELRRDWHCYWLVDPLDGTREFIDRTGEFTVNIALIEGGRPVLGVIYQPLQEISYVGIPQQGIAYSSSAGTKKALRVSSGKDLSELRVLTSSRHRNDQLIKCIDLLGRNFPTVKWIKAGSAVKFCHLAEGLADIYPRFSPCCEWDIAAGQALLEAAGGCLVDMDFKPFQYNQRASLINPPFYALAAKGVDWQAILSS